MRAARSSGYRSTARGRSRRWRRGVLALATAVGMVAMLAGIALAANPATATLSNGAQLTVSIDSPATGTEFVGSSVDVPVAGKASIGVGAQDATIVYVMDFSGSTGGTPFFSRICNRSHRLDVDSSNPIHPQAALARAAGGLRFHCGHSWRSDCHLRKSHEPNTSR